MASAPTAVAVSNIPYAATPSDTQARLVTACPPWISITHGDRGTCRIEFRNRADAATAVAAIRRLTMRTSDNARPFTLKATILAGPATSFIQTDRPRQWPCFDPTALTAAQQKQDNAADFSALLDCLPAEGMRPDIEGAVAKVVREEGATLKELYLAKGRRCELVFARGGGQGTQIMRSHNETKQEHLDQFAHLFEGLSADHRRTGIEATLHRISRTIHAVTKEPVAITARVGRTIQGHVLPMLVAPAADEAASAGDGMAVDERVHSLSGLHMTPEASLRALAQLARRGLLIIGRNQRTPSLSAPFSARPPFEMSYELALRTSQRASEREPLWPPSGQVYPLSPHSAPAWPSRPEPSLGRRSSLVMPSTAPNVGKTTVLRELARLLSEGDERVVVVVDKSLEVAGCGVLPHKAIRHARVLTVEHPSQQHKVTATRPVADSRAAEGPTAEGLTGRRC